MRDVLDQREHKPVERLQEDAVATELLRVQMDLSHMIQISKDSLSGFAERDRK